MKNMQTIQGIISLAAIICLLVGMFNVFTPEINDFLSRKLFYILIGVSFILMAPFMTNKNYIYPMYAAGILCIAGAFIPAENRFSAIKTIGILAGVILSFSNRSRQVNR